MAQKPKKSPVAAALKKKGTVTVGRLKEVRDSLIQEGQRKMGAGDAAMSHSKRSKETGEKSWHGKTAKESEDYAHMFWAAGTADHDRADRYDGLIKKAISVSKKRK